MPFIPDNLNTQTQSVQISNFKADEQDQGFWKRVGSGAKGLAVGALKGAGTTISNIGTLGQRGLEKITGLKSETPTLNETFGEKLKPKGTAENVGFAGEQIAEFFIPAGQTARAVKASEKAIEVLPKVTQGIIKLAARSGIAAGEAYGVSKLQGKSDEEAKFAAILGGAIPIASAGVSRMFKKTATKIEQSLIRPTDTDLKDGFDVNNIFKYNLGGNLETTATKLNDKFNSLTKELAKITKNSNVKVNLNNALDEVAEEMQKTKYATFGINTKIKNAVDFLKQEIADVSKDGVVSLPEAMQIKRSVGKLGAWQYGVKDPDATALETVANKLYTKLRVITQSSEPGLQRIEKQLSDLIPIETAIIRRIPVAERQNIVSLTDLASIIPSFSNPANMWLFALNRLSKSGNVANVLQRTSNLIEGTPGARGPVRATIMGTGDNVETKTGSAIFNIKNRYKNSPLSDQGGYVRLFEGIPKGKPINPKVKPGSFNPTDDTGSAFYNRLNKYEAEALKNAKTGLKGEGEILSQVAKKYKSADEFVKAQGTPVYHGTNYEKFDPVKAVSNDGLYGKGVYFASDKNVTRQYGGKTIEAFLDENSLLKINKPLTPQQQTNLRKVMGKDEWDWSKNPTGDFVWKRLELTHKNPESLLKKAGIKGIQHEQYIAGGKNINYTIFDNSAIKTKSQLTDIWKKANKDSNIIANPRKGSLAAEAAKRGTNRPIHQIQIEQAIARGDIDAAKRIVNSLPDTDPYKKSMLAILQRYE